MVFFISPRRKSLPDRRRDDDGNSLEISRTAGGNPGNLEISANSDMVENYGDANVFTLPQTGNIFRSMDSLVLSHPDI